MLLFLYEHTSLFMRKPVLHAGAFCCASELKSLVARSREQFFMIYRTSEEAIL